MSQDKYELYTGEGCGFCTRAKALLKRFNLEYTEYNAREATVKAELQKRRGLESLKGQTIPQVFVNGEYIGGFTELEKLL